MKNHIKQLLRIASELDSVGLFKEADAVDGIIIALAEEPTVEMIESEVKSPASKTKGKLPGDQDMARIQVAFNKYVRLAGGTYGPEGRSYEDVVPVNGNVGDRRTWTAIAVQFPDWFHQNNITKPKFKSYKELLKLLQGEISLLEGKAAKEDTAFENKTQEVLAAWKSFISASYDPKDQGKYSAKDLPELLAKLKDLPPQRGPTDPLHENAADLAAMLKTAVDSKDLDKLEQFNVSLGGLQLVAEED
jgi:hypothetical protein